MPETDFKWVSSKDELLSVTQTHYLDTYRFIYHDSEDMSYFSLLRALFLTKRYDDLIKTYPQLRIKWAHLGWLLAENPKLDISPLKNLSEKEYEQWCINNCKLPFGHKNARLAQLVCLSFPEYFPFLRVLQEKSPWGLSNKGLALYQNPQTVSLFFSDFGRDLIFKLLRIKKGYILNSKEEEAGTSFIISKCGKKIEPNREACIRYVLKAYIERGEKSLEACRELVNSFLEIEEAVHLNSEEKHNKAQQEFTEKFNNLLPFLNLDGPLTDKEKIILASMLVIGLLILALCIAASAYLFSCYSLILLSSTTVGLELLAGFVAVDLIGFGGLVSAFTGAVMLFGDTPQERCQKELLISFKKNTSSFFAKPTIDEVDPRVAALEGESLFDKLPR